MTPETEQAQAIARIKAQEYFQTTRGAAIELLVRDKNNLLEIIDFQAQKIAASATVIDEMHAHTVTLNALYLQAEQKISDQAKTIEINAAYAIELQGKIAEQAKEIANLKKHLLLSTRIHELFYRGKP